MPFRMCMYCGKEIKGRYEEYQEYFECECADAKKEREIKEKIRKLKAEIPEPKYDIVTENVLYKLDENY